MTRLKTSQELLLLFVTVLLFFSSGGQGAPLEMVTLMDLRHPSGDHWSRPALFLRGGGKTRNDRNDEVRGKRRTRSLQQPGSTKENTKTRFDVEIEDAQARRRARDRALKRRQEEAESEAQSPELAEELSGEEKPTRKKHEDEASSGWGMLKGVKTKGQEEVTALRPRELRVSEAQVPIGGVRQQALDPILVSRYMDSTVKKALKRRRVHYSKASMQFHQQVSGVQNIFDLMALLSVRVIRLELQDYRFKWKDPMPFHDYDDKFREDKMLELARTLEPGIVVQVLRKISQLDPHTAFSKYAQLDPLLKHILTRLVHVAPTVEAKALPSVFVALQALGDQKQVQHHVQLSSTQMNYRTTRLLQSRVLTSSALDHPQDQDQHVAISTALDSNCSYEPSSASCIDALCDRVMEDVNFRALTDLQLAAVVCSIASLLALDNFDPRLGSRKPNASIEMTEGKIVGRLMEEDALGGFNLKELAALLNACSILNSSSLGNRTAVQLAVLLNSTVGGIQHKHMRSDANITDHAASQEASSTNDLELPITIDLIASVFRSIGVLRLKPVHLVECLMSLCCTKAAAEKATIMNVAWILWGLATVAFESGLVHPDKWSKLMKAKRKAHWLHVEQAVEHINQPSQSTSPCWDSETQNHHQPFLSPISQMGDCFIGVRWLLKAIREQIKGVIFHGNSHLEQAIVDLIWSLGVLDLRANMVGSILTAIPKHASRIRRVCQDLHPVAAHLSFSLKRPPWKTKKCYL